MLIFGCGYAALCSSVANYWSQPLTEAHLLRKGHQVRGQILQVAGGQLIGRHPRVRNQFARIGLILHNQYVLGIVPPQTAPQGKYRRIKVQLVVPASAPRMQIFARSSYYVP